MIYFLLGQDRANKETKITDLKQKFLASQRGKPPSPEAEKFDYEVLYGNKLDSQTLKKALLALPAVARKRLILIRDCHKLNAHNKNLIIEFVSRKDDVVSTVLILESGELSPNDSFVKKIKPFAKTPTVAPSQAGRAGFPAKKTNVFDMTRAIGRRQKPEALSILSGLLSNDVHPLQVMGGLVWFWGKLRQQLASEKFEKGLLALQEADLNIKRSRLRPDYAMELLVVKLCGILG